MNFLTAEQQRMLADRLVAESIADDIKNINVLQMGERMLKAMVDPREMLAGVVGGFEKMLTGFANIGNWEAWQRDPLGNLLQLQRTYHRAGNCFLNYLRYSWDNHCLNGGADHNFLGLPVACDRSGDCLDGHDYNLRRLGGPHSRWPVSLLQLSFLH